MDMGYVTKVLMFPVFYKILPTPILSSTQLSMSVSIIQSLIPIPVLYECEFSLTIIYYSIFKPIGINRSIEICCTAFNFSIEHKKQTSLHFVAYNIQKTQIMPVKSNSIQAAMCEVSFCLREKKQLQTLIPPAVHSNVRHLWALAQGILQVGNGYSCYILI